MRALILDIDIQYLKKLFYILKFQYEI
jgi:hypothetical protein